MENGRGYFDFVEYQNGELFISGWMLLLDQSFDSFRIYINGSPVAMGKPLVRTDLKKVYPHIPKAELGGYSFTIPIERQCLSGMTTIAVVGIHAGQEIAIIDTLFSLDIYYSFPTPPLIIRDRVGRWPHPHSFWISALKTYGHFASALKRHYLSTSIHRMLDWGCGCGRVTACFLRYAGIEEVIGCDIDGEAIGWCQKNLAPARFHKILSNPPTPFSDDTFDLIVSYSVFTHLNRKQQFSWLEEMRRILKPRALFLATVHGVFNASFENPTILSEVLERGISDSLPDSVLDGVAPEGYYRSTYQTREYTEKNWSKYFDILEYIERGSDAQQDLIVMRRGQ